MSPSRWVRSRSTPRSRVNYSLGTVLRFGDFEATIDAYRIDIDDRIVLSENLNTPQVAALIAPFGATVARFFINGVETKTEGIDLVARYLWRTENVGRFEFIAAGNWNDTEVEGRAVDQRHRQHLQRPACAVHAARAVRAHQHAELRRRHARQQDEPGCRLDHAVGGGSVGVNLKGTRYGEVVEPGVPTTAEINAGVEDARDLHIQPDWVVDLALNTKLMDDKLGFTSRRRQPVRSVPGSRAERARGADAARRNREPQCHERAGVLALFAVWLQRTILFRAHVFQLVTGRLAGPTADGPAI